MNGGFHSGQIRFNEISGYIFPRLSFGDYARSSNIDIHTISKLLRHTKLSTTERYLSSFDPVSADNAMSKLFGGEE